MALTDEELAELQRLERAATPGEWDAQSECVYGAAEDDSRYCAKVCDCMEDVRRSEESIVANAAFIAAARNALPELLRELVALRGEAQDLRETWELNAAKLDRFEKLEADRDALVDTLRRIDAIADGCQTDWEAEHAWEPMVEVARDALAARAALVRRQQARDRVVEAARHLLATIATITSEGWYEENATPALLAARGPVDAALAALDAAGDETTERETPDGARLGRLLARLPARCYLDMRTETDEGGRPFLSACVIEDPPDGGWTSRGQYFHHPPDAASHREPCPEQWRYDTSARLGVTSGVDDAAGFVRLVVGMLEEFVAAAGAGEVPDGGR